MNLLTKSETHWDSSANELSNFVNSNGVAKNFGESITIDEDTASSSEGEEYAAGKLYPVCTSEIRISQYICTIKLQVIIQLIELIEI